MKVVKGAGSRGLTEKTYGKRGAYAWHTARALQMLLFPFLLGAQAFPVLYFCSLNDYLLSTQVLETHGG